MSKRQTGTMKSGPLDLGEAASDRAEAAARFLGIPLSRNQEGTLLHLHDLEQAATSLELIDEFFGGDVDRTRQWFCAPNLLLGGVEPRMMVIIGRTEKLLSFIRSGLQENPPV